MTLLSPDRADRAGRRLAAALGSARRACNLCGFEDTVHAGDWRVRVGRDDRSGHAVYHLECPDCATVIEVALDIP